MRFRRAVLAVQQLPDRLTFYDEVVSAVWKDNITTLDNGGSNSHPFRYTYSETKLKNLSLHFTQHVPLYRDTVHMNSMEEGLDNDEIVSASKL